MIPVSLVVVELPDHRLLAIQPSYIARDEDDSLVSDLIESNVGFRALLKKSAAAPRKPLARQEPAARTNG